MTIVAGFGAEAVGQGGTAQGPILAGIAGKPLSWSTTAVGSSSSTSQPVVTSFLSSWQTQLASLASGMSAKADQPLDSETGGAPADLAAGESECKFSVPTSPKSSALGMELENDPRSSAKRSLTARGQTGALKPISAFRTSIVRAQSFDVESTANIEQRPRPSASARVEKNSDTWQATHKSSAGDAFFNAGLPSTADPRLVVPAVATEFAATSTLREQSQPALSGAAPIVNSENTFASDAQRIALVGKTPPRTAAINSATAMLSASDPGRDLTAVPRSSSQIQTSAEVALNTEARAQHQTLSRGDSQIAPSPVQTAVSQSDGPVPGQTSKHATLDDQPVAARLDGNQRPAEASRQSVIANSTGSTNVESSAPDAVYGQGSITGTRTKSMADTQPAQAQNQAQVGVGSQPAQNIAPPTSGFMEDGLKEASETGAFSSPATSRKVTSSGTGGIGRPAEQTSLRNDRGFASIDRVEHLTHPFPAVSGAAAQDASGLVRDPEAMRGTTGTNPGSAGLSPGSTTESSAHEAFAALDADANSSSPNWIHAGTRRAEAGYQDPALGWIGVRADVSGGGVHATLLPSSSEAAQVLGGHMAGLDAYLSAEHTSVRSLTLTTPEGREPGFASGQDLGQGMNQGSGQSGYSEPQPSSRASMAAIATSVSRDMQVQSGRLNHTTEIPTLDGTHISVMA